MASWDQHLISRFIRQGKDALERALVLGIGPADCLTSEGRAAFERIMGYYNSATTRGSVLGPNSYREIMPMLELVDDVSLTTDAICHELRMQRVRTEAKGFATKFAERVEVDPIGALNEMQSHLMKLQSLSSNRVTDVRFADALKEIVSDYELRKSGVITARAAWPWDLLNRLSGGINDDDYIVLYGRPKSMKTWVFSSVMAHLFDHDKRVLLYTKEMTPKNIYKRIAACIVGIPYQELRTGELIVEHERHLYDLLEYANEIERSERFICLSGQDVQDGADTVQWVRAKVEQYKPDVCGIDGLYLLSENSGGKNMALHEKILRISRATRQMILATKVPVICTLQANRRAAAHANAELDEIAYSDAIGQDATVAMRVIRDKAQQTISLIMAGSREFDLHGFRINAVPATDFSFKEILSEKEILKAKENDTAGNEEADNPAAHAKARRQPSTMNGKKQSGTRQAGFTKQAEDILEENLRHL